MKSGVFSALFALALVSFGFAGEASAQKASSHSSFGQMGSSAGGVLGTIGRPSDLALNQIQPTSAPPAQVFYREAVQSPAAAVPGKASTAPSSVGLAAENPFARLMDLIQRECAVNPSSAHCQSLRQEQPQAQTASACGGTRRGGEEVFQRSSGGNPGYAGSCGKMIGAHVQCHSCSAHWEYINADLLRCVCD